jgi:hypothetical protein
MNSITDRSSTERLRRVPASDVCRSPQPRRLTETGNRSEPALATGPFAVDEALIVDARASLRPAQIVERKLMSLLKSVYLPVSHVRTTALCNARGPFPVASVQPDRKASAPPVALRSTVSKRETQAVAAPA